jgi:hypothetical protein
VSKGWRTVTQGTPNRPWFSLFFLHDGAYHGPLASILPDPKCVALRCTLSEALFQDLELYSRKWCQCGTCRDPRAESSHGSSIGKIMASTAKMNDTILGSLTKIILDLCDCIVANKRKLLIIVFNSYSRWLQLTADGSLPLLWRGQSDGAQIWPKRANPLMLRAEVQLAWRLFWSDHGIVHFSWHCDLPLVPTRPFITVLSVSA